MIGSYLKQIISRKTLSQADIVSLRGRLAPAIHGTFLFLDAECEMQDARQMPRYCVKNLHMIGLESIKCR